LSEDVDGEGWVTKLRREYRRRENRMWAGILNAVISNWRTVHGHWRKLLLLDYLRNGARETRCRCHRHVVRRLRLENGTVCRLRREPPRQYRHSGGNVCTV